MIVPQPRLLLFFAIGAVPAAVLASLVPGLALPMSAAMLLAGLIAGLDALSSLGRLNGITIEPTGVIRLTRDRPGTIDLHFKSQTPRPMRLGLAFPPEIFCEDEVIDVRPLDSESMQRVGWEVHPLRRGRFPLEHCYIEASSPLGLWAVRGSQPINADVRVYPNLASERRAMAGLFLNREGIGTHTQRWVGKGHEFEKLREYIPGDNYEDIHWKATARRGFPITKTYQVERTQEIYVIVDASRLSNRDARQFSTGFASPDDSDAHPPTILDREIMASLVLGLVAERQGDLFGLVTFSDQVHSFIRASNGQAHYGAVRDALYTLEPRSSSPDFAELFTTLATRLRRRSLLVFLTSLDDPALAENFADHIDIVGRRHLVMVNMLAPYAARPLFDESNSVNVHSMDDLYMQLAGHLQFNDLRMLETRLKRRGAQFSLLENEAMASEVVTQYLQVKRRQIL